jgi:CheY-like chemotaxis protein
VHLLSVVYMSCDRKESVTPLGKPVLVVDDDAEHRRVCREWLEDEGYTVVQAADGKEALDYVIDRRNILPCLIVLDLSMPLVTGWEFLAITKSYVRLASIPVVLISAHEPKLDPLRHGTITAFLRKPYDGMHLLALVAKHSGESSSAAS